MISNIKIPLAFVASLFILYSTSGNAHQQKTAMTTLLFNERTGNLEISHRFYVHDAEHAVKHLLQSKADLIGDANTQDQFGDYVQQHFALRLNEQHPLRLNYVGHQLKGKFFWVYQEIAIPSNLSHLEIFHDSLQVIWPAQTNLVNIEGLGPVKSLRFSAKHGWQKIEL